jgi:WD40 repeat protein
VNLDRQLVDAIDDAGKVLVAIGESRVEHVRRIDRSASQDRVVATADASIGLWQVPPSSEADTALPLGKDEVKKVEGLDRRVATLDREGKVTVSGLGMLAVSNVHDVKWTAGSQLITLATDEVDVWNIAGEKIATAPVWADDAQYVDKTGVLWTCDDKDCIARDVARETEVSRLDVRPLGDISTTFRIPASGDQLHARDWRFLLPPISTVARAMNGIRLLAYGDPGHLVAWDGNDAAHVFSHDAPVTSRADLRPATSPAGIAFAEGSTLRVVPRTGSPHEVKIPSGSVVATAWSADGKLAAVAAPFQAWLVPPTASVVGEPVIGAGAFGDQRAAGINATFSPKGDHFAVVTGANTIEVYETANETAPPAVYEGAGVIRSMYLSDAVVVARTRDGIVVWNKPGAPTHRWFGNFRDVRLDVKGRYLIALADQTVHVFDVELGMLTRRTTLPGDSIDLDDAGTRYAVSQLEQQRVVVFSFDGTARTVPVALTPFDADMLFRPGGGEHLMLRAAHVLVSMTGHRDVSLELFQECVYGGAGGRLLCIYNRPTGRVVQPFSIRDRKLEGATYELPPYEQIVFSNAPDEAALAIGFVGRNKTTLVAWDPKRLDSNPASLELNTRIVDIRVKNGQVLALGEDGHLDRWTPGGAVSSTGGARVAEISAGPPLRIAISAPGRGIVVKSVNGASVESQEVRQCMDAKHARFASPDRLVCVRTPRGDSTNTGDSLIVKELGKLDPPWSAQLPSSATALAVFGDVIVVGLANGEIWYSSGKLAFSTLRGNNSAIGALAINQAGSWLASAAADGTVTVWTIERSGDEFGAHELVRFSACVRPGCSALAFEPGTPSPALVTGGPDGEIMRWSLTGK